EQVGFRSEVAQVDVAGLLGVLHRRPHALAIETMERIAFDHLRADAFTAEDVREALHHRRGAGAAGAGDGDDRMLDAHARASGRNSERSLNSGEMYGWSCPQSGSR